MWNRTHTKLCCQHDSNIAVTLHSWPTVMMRDWLTSWWRQLINSAHSQCQQLLHLGGAKPCENWGQNKTWLTSDFTYWHRCYRSVVCLSVCHVRALCSNGRRYRHDFFCILQPYVSHRFKIWLTSANSFLPKFCPKLTHSPLIERRMHSMVNYVRMVRGS